MIARVLAAALVALALTAPAAGAATPAQGNFGLNQFDALFANENETLVSQAGSHPFSFTVQAATNVDGKGSPEGQLRDIFITQAPGLVGDTTAYPRCAGADFLEVDAATGFNNCPLETTLGIAGSAVSAPNEWFTAPVFNLEPPPGVLLRLGFRAVELNIVIDVILGTEPPYLPVAIARNAPQLAQIFAIKTQLWGDPASPAHDDLRGPCAAQKELPIANLEDFRFESKTGKKCPVAPRERPLLTMPTDCSGPLATSYRAFSWEGPTAADDGFDTGSTQTHDEAGTPSALTGCDALPPFDPRISAHPTTSSADSPSGLNFELAIDDPGLTSTKAGALAKSQIEKVLVTFPEGMTVNPSQAEGLETCSEEQLSRETPDSGPGDGCPQASKIGTLEVDSPLLDKTVRGALFVATPHANLAGDSLIAVYAVFKDRELGIAIKQPIRVTPDPETGRLRSLAEDIPPLSFSSFRLRFREGGRSPLVTPPACGSHNTEAVITPRAGTGAYTTSSSFEISSGPGGGDCPPAGPLPFKPGFAAGSHNNAAGAHSPFSMRLTRRDGDQDLVRFDATLPPGLTARLAGVTRCSEAGIAQARSKSGKAELSSPSCPSNSHIGRVLGGAGAGTQLTYVEGRLYLAGPFAGAPLSAVAIVPAVAGPFDVGTVVVRQALRINPRTGVVTADGGASQPIPHILEGIPLRVRDVQVHVDRSNFTLNPTSCEPSGTSAQLWGGGLNPFSLLDNTPVSAFAPFQAASCAALPYKPRFALRLKGGTKRGDFPALRLAYRPRAGDANLQRLSLRFPHSEFIEQGHFRTICTRVQFAAGAGFGANCPKRSVYGRARVFTPLLDEPVEGPVFLRSSDNNLPDVVLALHGPPGLPIHVEVPTRIDSVKGGLRAIAAATPDLPVSKAIVNMQGGQKGLFVNSTDICARKHRATVELDAHNGKHASLRPLLRARCGKGRRGRSR